MGKLNLTSIQDTPTQLSTERVFEQTKSSEIMESVAKVKICRDDGYPLNEEQLLAIDDTIDELIIKAASITTVKLKGSAIFENGSLIYLCEDDTTVKFMKEVVYNVESDIRLKAVVLFWRK